MRDGYGIVFNVILRLDCSISGQYGGVELDFLQHF
jgi:hypothetical protein